MSNTPATAEYTYQGDPVVGGVHMSHIVIEAQEQNRLVGFAECKTVESDAILASIGVREFAIIFEWNGQRSMIKAGLNTNIDALIPEEMRTASEVKYTVIAGPTVEGSSPRMPQIKEMPNFVQSQDNVVRQDRFENSTIQAVDMNVVSTKEGILVVDNN